jgi:hypothetical protein
MSTGALHTKSELPLSVGNPYIVQSETNGFAGDEENYINLENLNKEVSFDVFYDYLKIGNWTITGQQYNANNNLLSVFFRDQLFSDEGFFFDDDIHALTAEATADTNIQEDLMSKKEPFIVSTPVDIDDLAYVAMCMFGLHRSNIQDHIPSRVWKFTITDKYGRPLN